MSSAKDKAINKAKKLIRLLKTNGIDLHEIRYQVSNANCFLLPNELSKYSSYLSHQLRSIEISPASTSNNWMMLRLSPGSTFSSFPMCI